jgi:hypothetical protein
MTKPNTIETLKHTLRTEPFGTKEWHAAAEAIHELRVADAASVTEEHKCDSDGQWWI